MDAHVSSPSGEAMGSPLRLSWVKPRGLVSLSFVNALLRIITLGIYGFWAKTEVRKRIWSGVRLNEEPLQYTGTGMELFKGFLIVFFCIMLPVIAAIAGVVVAFGPESLVTAIVQVGVYVLFLFLAFVAVYRAQRYRLSRTFWRGIRGGLDGNSFLYGGSAFWRTIANIITLGWLTPVNSVHLQGMITRNMRFGSKPFSFTATSGRLYGPFAVVWFGLILSFVGAGFLAHDSIVTIRALGKLAPGQVPPVSAMIGIGSAYLLLIVAFIVLGAWYNAYQIRHFAAHTHYQGATFSSTVTGRGLVWITFTNFLIVFLSLSILTPIAQARLARYLVTNLSIEGTVSLDEILQGADANMTGGEGLAQAFDVDAF